MWPLQASYARAVKEDAVGLVVKATIAGNGVYLADNACEARALQVAQDVCLERRTDGSPAKRPWKRTGRVCTLRLLARKPVAIS